MRKLLIFSVAGFIAQLIDGSLGMAYGLTSSSVLLAFGIAPAIASASIHTAEIATTAASGLSHLKLGNVHKQIVFRMVIPGSIGAFAGACFLSNLPGDIVAPYISLFLLVLGIYITLRFLFQFEPKGRSKEFSKKQLIPLGLFAGFCDSVGGGGWGPISTPVLLSQKGIAPRKVIGSVDTSEFLVAVSGTLGFLISLGPEKINWLYVAIFAVSGLVAAPVAAWLVRIFPPHLLGLIVGGAIVFTNSRTVLHAFGVSVPVIYFIYLVIAAVWIVAIIAAIKKNRQIREEDLSV
ncbi:sulfite exporter TauE/SafE family protein [Sporolactobacillus sp. THM7-7]|nr:sulfite exporter TauE/SafE family protein [Sporolactobacillus sp. THM7-7]